MRFMVWLQVVGGTSIQELPAEERWEPQMIVNHSRVEFSKFEATADFANVTVAGVIQDVEQPKSDRAPLKMQLMGVDGCALQVRSASCVNIFAGLVATQGLGRGGSM